MHSFSHSIKLFFLRFRWAFQAIVDSQVHNKIREKYDLIKTLLDKNQQEFLRAERGNPTAKDTYILKGRVEILTEILNANSQGN